MKSKLSIVKIGGNLIGNQEALTYALELFSKVEGHKILVHGGGKKATEISHLLGIESKIIQGRRITDAKSLEVAIMVYGGLINKTLVAQLQGLGTNAIGMSGADANTILAHRRPIKEVDFGYVGDVDTVNKKHIAQLLEAGFTPIFCALTHDGKGQLFNTNADTIAAELAAGLAPIYETTLFYCFEKPGVLRNVSDEDSVIEHINSKKYEQLLEKNVISDGMLPKMQNGFYALRHNVRQVNIGNETMLSRIPLKYTRLTL